MRYLPGRNPLFHGEPPPEWEPLPRRPSWRALFVTVALVIAITLLMLLTLPEGEEGASSVDCSEVSGECSTD